MCGHYDKKVLFQAPVFVVRNSMDHQKTEVLGGFFTGLFTTGPAATWKLSPIQGERGLKVIPLISQ